MESGKIDFFSATHTNVIYVNTSILQSVGESHFKRLAGQPYIATYDNALRFQVFAISSADTIGNILIQLFT
ncbi:hypothetical protein N040_16075 [Serratia marcescens EGD-HP20]|nr:hypothetical protein N040_16075 [Serratia marcescens EGD-HP20]